MGDSQRLGILDQDSMTGSLATPDADYDSGWHDQVHRSKRSPEPIQQKAGLGLCVLRFSPSHQTEGETLW